MGRGSGGGSVQEAQWAGLRDQAAWPPWAAPVWLLGLVGITVCLRPSPPPPRDVFPQGLPDEYAFVTTFRFRKSSRKEDWYIWQVIDQYGIPQVRGRPTASGLCAGP